MLSINSRNGFLVSTFSKITKFYDTIFSIYFTNFLLLLEGYNVRNITAKRQLDSKMSRATVFMLLERVELL